MVTKKRKSSRRRKQKFYLHLVSDATGTTLLGLARACTAQFDDIETSQKFWPLIRTERQLERVIKKIEQKPGPVIFTMVNEKMRARLQDRCDELGLPCTAVLDPIMHSLSSYLGLTAKGVPGLQHAMDDAYFRRVAAIDFAMRYDDGKKLEGIKEAEIVLVGVSRTSKTPTSFFLARRGIKCANIPLVPDVPIDEEMINFDSTFYVGLTASPKRLVSIRRNRLNAEEQNHEFMDNNAYLDEEKIEEEVRDARRMFSKHGWPVIDVSKRSVEETAAEITVLYEKYKSKRK